MQEFLSNINIELVASVAISIFTGIGTMVAIACKIISSVKKMKADIQVKVDNIAKDVNGMTEAQKLELALAAISEENAALKKQIKALVNKIDKINAKN